MRGRSGTRARFSTSVGAAVALAAGALFTLTPAQAQPAATAAPSAPSASAPAPLIGAASTDFGWFDQAVGPMQIYRNFDSGFSWATWQQTPAYQNHPNAPMNDYSIEVQPQHLTTPGDPMIARIKAFIATTPKNAILSNLHEPDHSFPGHFTPAQFRAAILTFAGWVRAQNAADGGTRMTSVILMDVTFDSYGTTTADQWWPTDARDGGHVDIIEGDMYALPHNTATACCPTGYTDGVNWRTAAYTLDPLRKFAQANNTPWAIAELGYLEDIHDPMHKADELAAAVAYATKYGAHHVNYFDAAGSRADWRLRYAAPVGTQSQTSNAARMWKSLAAGNTGPANAAPTASATGSCSALTCTFDGAGSSDPDGTVSSYAWTFGDGGTASGVRPSHTYAAGGKFTYTLTVTDDQGAVSAPFSATVSPVGGGGTGPAAPIVYAASAHAYLNVATPANGATVTLPGAVAAGDTELLVVSTGVSGAAGAPSGWTQVGRADSTPLQVTVYARVAADSGDAGAKVTVPITATTAVALQVLDYRSVGTPITVASSIDNGAASHTTPAAAVGAGSWVVSCWVDRSSTTTGWTVPATVTSRDTVVGTGGGHVSDAVADTGAALAAGTYPGQTAGVIGGTSGRGAALSVVLSPAG